MASPSIHTAQQRMAQRSQQWLNRMESVSLPIVLAAAALALAWLLPGHYPPWTSFQQEAVAAVAGLLFCWAALQIRSTPRLSWPMMCWWPIAVAFVPWAQLAAGQIGSLDDALLPSLYLVALALSISVGASISQGQLRTQFMEGLAAAAVTAAILSTGLALWQWLGLDSPGMWLNDSPPGGRPYANIAQPNHLSTVLVLGLTGLLRWYEAGRVGRVVGFVGAAWIGWGIAMTQSRTGLLCLAILATGCLLFKNRCRLRTTRWAVVGAALVFVLFVLIVVPLRDWFMHSDAPQAGLRTEAGTRVAHWVVLGDAVLNSPWVGYGWNQVSLAQWEFAPRHSAVGEYLMHSHNLFLDLALYAGVPIAVVFLVGLAAWSLRALVRCRDPASWSLLAAWFALLTHAMLEYPLHYMYFLLPTGLMMGALHTPAPSGAWRQAVLPRAVAWSLVVVLSTLLTWITVDYMRVEESLRRLRFAFARIGVTTADLTSPQITLIPSWKRYHDSALIQPKPGMRPAELRELRDMARRYSYVPSMKRYAVALGLNGQPDEAHAVLARICKVYRDPFISAARESWETLQAAEPALSAVPFPNCQSIPPS